MKKIKIFAAFGKDVEEDVTRFGDFLCALNAQCKNIELSVFKSEKELCESLEQSKEKVDSELDTCEYFLLILGGKHDNYPFEKLNQAIAAYAKTRGNPSINIFINNSKEDADKNIGFFASDEYQHYVEQFSHNDTLKAKFLVWLSAKQKDIGYEVDTDNHGNPVIKINGRPVSGLLDFDAFLNNEDYQDEKKKLIKNKAKREEYIKDLQDAEEDEKSDLWDDISALTKEIEERQDKIAKMERDTLALYQNYAKKTLESGYSSRLKRAVECIERGELERAKRVLDPEGSLNNLKAISNENEILASRIEENKKIAQQDINILFAEIDRLKLDTHNPNRFVEIEKCYANIEHFQEVLALEMTVLPHFAEFLRMQKKFFKAADKVKKELSWYKKEAKLNPDKYLPETAGILNKLVVIQREIKYITEAENNINEALAIYRKLADKNSAAFLPGVAAALNNLAGLQRDTNRYNEAKVNYAEAIKIRRTLAESNPDAYLPYLAWSLSSLSVMQKDTNHYKEAEENIKEAIKIRRGLAALNPDAYLSDLAWSINSLVVIQRDINHFTEAEKNITEALGIYRKLAEVNPDASLPDLAMALNNLAGIQRDTKRYNEAETNYAETINIRRKLAETNPDSCYPDVAWSLNSLADMQIFTDNFEEAERNCKEAISIRRKLTQTNPETYMPDLAWSLNSLASVLRETKRLKEARENIDEALGIYRSLKEKNPEAYFPEYSMALNNLADIQRDQKLYKEAEENYLETLSIRRKLAETNHDKYFPDVEKSLNCLIDLYSQTNRNNEAEELRKAIKVIEEQINAAN